MPRYYFRCSGRDGDHSDIWGIALPDVEAALALAVAEAETLCRKLHDPRAAGQLHFEVEGEDGMPIMHVPVVRTAAAA